MNYSGDVYIFDFDDTLMWSADWYSEVSLDKDDFVIDPGKSGSLSRALRLLADLGKKENIPDRFKNLKIKKALSRQLNRRDIYFLILDSNDHTVLVEELERFVSQQKLREANIQGTTEYSLYAAVIEDVEYYRNLETVGTMGPNDEIMKLYISKAGDGIVLTARSEISGMHEKISSVLYEHSGYKPKHVYAQPLNSGNSGTFKAGVLFNIASQDTVDSIHFYEDNPEYIKTILNFLFLEKRKSEEKGNIVDKVHINPVSVNQKPDVNFKVKGD